MHRATVYIRYCNVCHLTKLSLNLSEMNPGERQAILKPYVTLKMLLKYAFN